MDYGLLSIQSGLKKKKDREKQKIFSRLSIRGVSKKNRMLITQT